MLNINSKNFDPIKSNFRVRPSLKRPMCSPKHTTPLQVVTIGGSRAAMPKFSQFWINSWLVFRALSILYMLLSNGFYLPIKKKKATGYLCFMDTKPKGLV